MTIPSTSPRDSRTAEGVRGQKLNQEHVKVAKKALLAPNKSRNEGESWSNVGKTNLHIEPLPRTVR